MTISFLIMRIDRLDFICYSKYADRRSAENNTSKNDEAEKRKDEQTKPCEEKRTMV